MRIHEIDWYNLDSNAEMGDFAVLGLIYNEKSPTLDKVGDLHFSDK